MSDRVVIVAMGASTPVGRDAWSSAAAVRAGISGLHQHPYMIDTAGEPMKVAAAPWLDIATTGVDRMAMLAFPAIDQVIAEIDEMDGGPWRLALALGLPSPRPGLPEDLDRQMIALIRKHFRSRFEGVASFAAGHAAGHLALLAAITKLGEGTLDACVVAGVDSYIEPSTLEWLEDCDQLHGAGRLNNAWGFIPGEASAALLVMRESTARARGLAPLAMVLGTGIAMEDKRIKTETVCIGEGLTEALRAALAGLPRDARVTDLYCDLNGEPYRADEFGFAALRTGASFESASDFVAPADCWGDVAAASGPLHLMLATIAGQNDYANGPLALAFASAEAGQRAAVLLATASRVQR